MVRAEGARLAVEERLVRWTRPLLRVPNLAIHLNRQVNQDGLRLNEQDHLPAVFAARVDGPTWKDWLAAELAVGRERILGWDLCLADVVPPATWGRDEEFYSAPRLDDLACAHAGLTSFLAAGAGAHHQVLGLFDHEEIGSRSTRGAQSSFLRDVLTRLAGDNEAMVRACSRSRLLSADMAHGVHPNYADKHEPEHRPVLGLGPVLKTHGEWRYATEAATASVFRGLCADLGVPTQEFMNRTDLACGTTIGPIVAAELGIPTVDIGSPMWSMHSIRETGAIADVDPMITAMRGFYEWDDAAS
jgi:aspartyl aminopeptidase